MDSSQVALAYFELQRPCFGKPFFELHKQCLSQALPSTIGAYRDRDQVIMVLPVIDNTIAHDLVVQSEHEKGLRIVACEFRQKVGWIRIVEACLFYDRDPFNVVMVYWSDVNLLDCLHLILIPLKILRR